MERKTWKIVGAGCVVLAGVLIYWPALRGDMLWDDARYIFENRVLRETGGLWRIWFEPEARSYYPLQVSLQWVQWQLWQDSRLGYHLVSVGAHCLSALLLWRIGTQLRVAHAWLGALIFVVHPLAVESVAWMAEQKNTLSLPWLLVAFSAWLAFDEQRRKRDYAVALLCFAAAALTKSAVVMFPAVLLLHVWWKRQRITLRDVRATAPFLLLSLALGLVAVWFEHTRAIGEVEVHAGTFPERIARAGIAVVLYTRNAIWPVELMPIYPRWSITPFAFWHVVPWLGFVGIAALCWRFRSSWGRHALFGGGVFVLNLVPALGLVSLSSLYVYWMADHLAYFSLAGLAIALTALAGQAPARLPTRFFWSSAAAMLAVLGILSHTHARHFRNAEVFWSYAVARNPETSIGWLNLGNAMAEQGRGMEAVGCFTEAARLAPDDPGGRISLGNALGSVGEHTSAHVQFEHAVRLAPQAAEAHDGLGRALLDLGRIDEAIVSLQRAVTLSPGLATAHNNLGIALARSGRPAEAISHFEEAVRLDADLAAARTNLEQARADAGPPAAR